MRANDAVSGLVLVVLAAAMIGITTTFPDFPGQNYGPALFPRVLGAFVIVCGALLMRRGMATRRSGAPLVEMAPWTRSPWRVGSFALMLGLLLVYILVSETVGFIPMALLTMLALFLWFGVRPVTAVVTSLVATLTIHWFFATLLRVPLPRGFLDSVL
jgi:putative tricarboxylic transport membrane protein